jgi:hypothetical protein
MFFYTKEYGKTRWEQWVSVNPDMQKNAAAAAKCVNGTSGGVVQFGYTTYYIQDCRDWSFTAPAQEGEWDPASFHIDPFHNSNNLLTNTHMQCTNAGAASDCGFGGTCQTIAPWQRIGNLNWGFDQSLMGAGRSANCALLISIPSPPAGQGVYQDVSNVQNPGAVYSFGASIWARNLAPGQTGSAEIVVFELNSSGGIVARNSVFATVGDTPRFTTGTFVMASATRRLRFQIYPQNQDMNYEISDSWAALQP